MANLTLYTSDAVKSNIVNIVGGGLSFYNDGNGFGRVYHTNLNKVTPPSDLTLMKTTNDIYGHITGYNTSLDECGLVLSAPTLTFTSNWYNASDPVIVKVAPRFTYFNFYFRPNDTPSEKTLVQITTNKLTFQGYSVSSSTEAVFPTLYTYSTNYQTNYIIIRTDGIWLWCYKHGGYKYGERVSGIIYL